MIDELIDEKKRRAKRMLSSTELLKGTTCRINAKTSVMVKSQVKTMLKVDLEESTECLRELALYACSNVDNQLIEYVA